MVVVLPEPFTPTTMMTAGGSATRGMGRSEACRISSKMLADEPFQFGGIAHQFAIHALADAVQNLLGGAHADVGTDQREFQFVEQIGIDFLGALEHVLETRD